MDNKDLEIGNGDRVDLVEGFCYLGDMIKAGGGEKDATNARVRCTWAKFRESSQILTARGALLRVKGKVYCSCMQSVRVYDSETWTMKVEDERNWREEMMVKWICV